MYPSPNEDAKQVLLGFNEKVTHLENSRFYRRYKDEPPNLLMFMDRIDKVESLPDKSEPRVTLTIQGYMRFSIENFDREDIEAFVLTYRILTQRNDRYSIHRVAGVYGSRWIDDDGRHAFEQAREQLKELFDSYTKMDFGEGPVRLTNLLDVVVYGALAHTNPKKELQYRAWSENPTMAAAVWIEFMGALLAAMNIFRHIQNVNSVLLFNVFKITPPEHLLSLTQQTLELICLQPTQVDATDAAQFMRLVTGAGEVNPKTLPTLFRRARIVCFARLNGHLAGVAALKRPYSGHRAKVFRQAMSARDPTTFPYEVGLFHVLDRFKGHHISSHMVEQLVRHTDGAPVYATSRIDNLPMHAALTAHGGFVRDGSEYSSEKGAVPLCLFVRCKEGESS